MDTTEVLDLALARRLAASGEARALRVASGLSQADAWRAVGGITRNAMTKWESGLRRPYGAAGARYGALLRSLQADVR